MRKTLNVSIKLETLAKSSPPCEICMKPTTFARYSEIGGNKIGRFAHIRAVSKGGPRYDPNYSREYIDSSDNLFWCCTDCHDIVDNEKEWSLDRLLTELDKNRTNKRTETFLIVEGEINVTGEDSENITGIDAGGKSTVLRPGTIVNVEGKRSKNIIGVKN